MQLLRSLLLERYVVTDARSRDDLSLTVAYRRQAERDADEYSVFANPFGIVLSDLFAQPDPLQQRLVFESAVLRHDDRDSLSDRVLRRITVNAFGRSVPRQNGAIDTLANDRVVR